MTKNDYFRRFLETVSAEVLGFDQYELFDPENPAAQTYACKRVYDNFKISFRLWAVEGTSKQRWFRLCLTDQITQICIESKSDVLDIMSTELLESCLSNMAFNESCVVVHAFDQISNGRYSASSIETDKKTTTVLEMIDGKPGKRCFDHTNAHLLIEYLRYRAIAPLDIAGDVDVTAMKIAERQSETLQNLQDDLSGLFKYSKDYTISLIPSRRYLLGITFPDARKSVLIAQTDYVIEGKLTGDELIIAGKCINIVKEHLDEFVRYRELTKSVSKWSSSNSILTGEERQEALDRLVLIKIVLRTKGTDSVEYQLRQYSDQQRSYSRTLKIENIQSKSKVLTVRAICQTEIDGIMLSFTEFSVKLHASNDFDELVKYCSIV